MFGTDSDPLGDGGESFERLADLVLAQHAAIDLDEVVAGIAGIAITRTVERDHPELSPIVDAAAQHLQENPDFRAIDVEDVDDVRGRVALTYVSTILTLSERPDLATPEILAALEDQAVTGGIGADDDYGGATMEALRDEVVHDEQALADHGIEPLPNGGCTMGDAFGEEGGG